MNSLMTEIWRCVRIAESKGEKVRIHIHPSTRHVLIWADKDLLFGVPVIEDKDIVENNFWIEVTEA